MDDTTPKVRVSFRVGGGAKSRLEWEGDQENGLEDSKDRRSASWYGNQYVRLRGAEVSRVSLIVQQLSCPVCVRNSSHREHSCATPVLLRL